MLDLRVVGGVLCLEWALFMEPVWMGLMVSNDDLQITSQGGMVGGGKPYCYYGKPKGFC